jgi:hypothetical protein
MKTESYSIQRLIDRAEITDRIHLVARGFDRKAWDIVADCYHPGATDNHGIYNGDIEGFIEFCIARHKFVIMSMHNISNILIEFTGEDCALVESYCFNWQRMSPEYDEPGWEDRKKDAGVADTPDHHGYLDRYGANRYVDVFTRVNGTWRIHERTVISEGFVMLDPPSLIARMDGPMITGRRDRKDRLFAIRDRLLGLKPPKQQ